MGQTLPKAWLVYLISVDPGCWEGQKKCHKRTSGNFPEADALSIAGDVNLALPKGHSAPTVGVTVARRRIQSLPEKDSEMTERISLEGKVAVVTGAGRGLGRAYVELLAERGARVVVNDLGTDVSGFGKDSTIAEQVADLIRSRGGEAIANDSDVSSPEGGGDLIATTIKHFGRVDLLVNNAGICGSQLFEDATLDDFDHYWRVHLGGPVNTVKAA